MKVDVRPTEQPQTYFKKEHMGESVKETLSADKHEKCVENIGEIFVQSSSLHGVNKLQKDSNVIRRAIWTILIMGCAVVLVYTVTNEIQNFYRYPTTTNIQINRFNEMPFPAVTICNLSPYNKTKLLPLGEKYMNYVMKYTTIWGPFSSPINWSDPEYQSSLYTTPITPESYNWGSMDPAIMFQVCTFDGIPCTANLSVMTTDIGPCFTFNEDGRTTTKFVGALNNLALQVYIDQKSYFYSHYFGSGIKVMVHKPGELPDILNSGFVVPPGNMAHAPIKASVHKNLPAPYKSSDSGYCLDTSTTKNPLKYHNYTYYSCIRECQTEHLKNKVGCVLPNLETEPPFCSLLDYPTYFATLSDPIYNTVVKEECISRCPNPCEQTKYDVTVSHAQFPSNFIADEVRRFNILNETNDGFRENFVQLALYYEDLTHTLYEQIPKYDSLGDVFANVGGQMGLFLGASILTLVEIIELIGTVSMILFRKVKQKKNP